MTRTKKKTKIIWELCPYCEREVKLKNSFIRQKCPKCKMTILPCSICKYRDWLSSEDYNGCDTCPIEGRK